MEVPILTLCDSAVDYQGKLCILGAFSAFQFKTIPARIAACSIATRLTIKDEDRGQNTIAIKIIEPDGTSLLTADKTPTLQFEHHGLKDDYHFANINFVCNFNGLEFKQFGAYELQLLHNGKILSIVPFQVAEVKEA